MITCRRCGSSSQPLAQAPMPGELGKALQESVCPACWQEWLRVQVLIINEYHLSLQDPQTRAVLTQHLKEFFQLAS